MSWHKLIIESAKLVAAAKAKQVARDLPVAHALMKSLTRKRKPAKKA